MYDFGLEVHLIAYISLHFLRFHRLKTPGEGMTVGSPGGGTAQDSLAYRGRGSEGGAGARMSVLARALVLLLLLILRTEARSGIFQPAFECHRGLEHGRRVELYNPSIVEKLTNSEDV